jgi:toxin FitB
VIVLDTNVLSELMRQQPAPVVVAWIDKLPIGTLFTTSITESEILHGVLLLPPGKKREAILRSAQGLFSELLADRVLPFGSKCALEYAHIAASRRASGRPISQSDAQIAAICKAERASMLATRNVADFDDCGLTVFNPWTG